jgi:hypothetical protein
MGLNKKEIKIAHETAMSEHFTLFEFINSASRPDLVEIPNDDIIEKGRYFSENVLEVIRAECNGGNPLRVNSWYRNPVLNAAKPIGGTKHSIHQIYYKGIFQGVATDIAPRDIYEVFSKIASLQNDVLRTAIIYPDRSFIHVDSNVNKPQMTFYVKFKTSSTYHAITRAEAANIKETLLKKFSLKVQ